MKHYNAIVIEGGAILKKTFEANSPQEAWKKAKEDFEKRLGVTLSDKQIIIVKVPEEVEK